MTDTDKIAALEARIAKLENTPETAPNMGPMTEAPRIGVWYWVLSSGKIAPCMWLGDSVDHLWLAKGGCYTTREAAEAAFNAQQAKPNTVAATQYEADMAELARLRAFVEALRGSAALLDNLHKSGCKI